MMQFQGLDCETLGELTFLRADSSIDCNSPVYKSFLVVDSLFIVAFQSIPLVWFVLLWRVRGLLNPHSSGVGGEAQDAAIQEHRMSDPRLAHLGFLWQDYTPRRWYYEVVDM